MPRLPKSRPSGESRRTSTAAVPARAGEFRTIQNRSVVVYDTGLIVVTSPSGRTEMSMALTPAERLRLGALLSGRHGVDSPELTGPLGDQHLSASAYLRQYAELLLAAEEADVVVTDAREDDVQGADFITIADWVDELEERDRLNDHALTLLGRKLDEALARDNTDLTADEREKLSGRAE